MTPTNSGPISFQYVFGSEEYPKYAPSAGINVNLHSQTKKSALPADHLHAMCVSLVCNHVLQQHFNN
jgi:hypothetical protein